MEEKVVVRFKDKTLMKGNATDFVRGVSAFHVRLLNGKVEEVRTEDLKAVFMVETWGGNRDYTCTYADVLPWGGHKVKVEFNDGEIIVGYTPYYPKKRQDFFVTPADLRSNNKRVYVIHSAVKNVYYL